MNKVIEYELLRDEFEVPKLCKRKTINISYTFDSSERIVDFMNKYYNMDNRYSEYLYILGIDSLKRPVGLFELGHGGEDGIINLSISQIFISLLAIGCKEFFVIHNHPAHVSNPSQDDINFTHRLNSAANLLGVKLIDHIIIARGSYYSLKYFNLF